MDKIQIDYHEVPAGYGHCISERCPLAATCLRAWAWKSVPETTALVQVLNPALTTEQAGCPYYRDSTPQTFAFGFKGMQSRMFPAQYSTFKSILIGHFGRSPFFYRRNGERPLPPQEQTLIRAALKAAGVPEDLDFDRYESHFLW